MQICTLFLRSLIMGIESFADYKKVFDFNIQDILNEVMLDLEKSIIQINQIDQLSFGIDAKSQVIKTLKSNSPNVYANFTIKERKARGLQTDNVDLNFTGGFWKTFKVVKVQDGWEVQANFNIHGEDIRVNFDTKFDFLGVSPDNLEDFVLSEVLPKLENKINKIKAKLGI